MQKPARIKRKTLEFNYTVRIERVSLNGGGSKSTETLEDLAEYINEDNLDWLTGGPIYDNVNYVKTSIDTMKMAGLGMFWYMETHDCIK